MVELEAANKEGRLKAGRGNSDCWYIEDTLHKT